MASTELRAAAQQALEALEALQGGCTDHDDGTVEAITVWCPEIITALKAALAQPVQEPDPTYKLIGCVQHDCEECQRRTRRPAEPVGVVTSMVKGGVTWQRWPADMPDGTLLFSEVQP